MLTLYGIPNCDTVKKACHWLEQQNLLYTFHDFKKMGIESSILQRWIDQVGIETIINKRGTTWRKLNPEQQALSVEVNNAIVLLIEYPSLIKRPVLETQTFLYIGFDADHYHRLLTPWTQPNS